MAPAGPERAEAFMRVMKSHLMRMNEKQNAMTKACIAAGLDGTCDAVLHRSVLHALGDRVLVSVVVPTTPSRRWTHRALYDCFKKQTWPLRELIVLETGGSTCPSPFWRKVARKDDRVTYKYEARDVTLGRKRNRFAPMAEGSVVAQFDDDDVYAPEYLDVMVAALLGDALDAYDGVDDARLLEVLAEPRLAQLASWVGYCVASERILVYDAHEDRRADEARAAERAAAGDTHDRSFGWHSRFYGYGFAYVFTLAYQVASPFNDAMHLHQDYVFVCDGAVNASARCVTFDDDLDYPCVVHIRHSGSSTDNPAIVPIDRPPGFPARQLRSLLADAPAYDDEGDGGDDDPGDAEPENPEATTLRTLAKKVFAE